MPKTTPLLSVIMPVFNAEKYLKQAIESILNQTYEHFEFIIINDGSTDNSLKIIKSYEDERIVLAENSTNKGIVYSLNKAINLAKGKYIARMDADDISLATRLETQVTFLEKNPTIKLIGTDTKIIDEKGQLRFARLNIPYEEEQVKIGLLFKNPFIHPTIMGHIDVFKQEKYVDAFFPIEDYHLWYRISKKYQVKNIKKILLHYRLHEGNIHRTKKEAVQQKLIAYYTLIFKKENLVFSQEQIQLHLELCGGLYATTQVNSNEAIENWLNALKKWNEEQCFSDPVLFEKELSSLWWHYNFHRLPKSKLSGFLKYLKSKWTKKHTWHQKVNLLIAVCKGYFLFNVLFEATRKVAILIINLTRQSTNK